MSLHDRLFETTRIPLKVKLLEHFKDLELPKYETTGSVGLDVRACIGAGKELIIYPNTRVCIPTGLAVSVPEGYELQVRPRSGLSLNTDLLIVNSPGTVDNDYIGEVSVIMGNFGCDPYKIPHGMRIAQWVITPVVKVTMEVCNDLELTTRGQGGYGSTGLL